jgi:hypothetical protein
MLTAMTRAKQETKPRHADINDRERLAQAFGELADRGYLLPFAGWDVCCPSCGWQEVAKQIGADEVLPGNLKTVWWHEQADSYAFCMDPSVTPQTEAFLDKMPDEDEENTIEVWLEAHAEEAAADSVLARLDDYAVLLEPLFINWRGDKNEIVAALRAQGLRVQVPDEDESCIVVLPARSVFHADPVNGEIVLHLDGDEYVLTVADAQRLAKQLNRAARRAVNQMPVL